MNARFGGTSRKVPLSRRSQAFILGGGVLFLSMLLMFAAILTQRSDIEAETSVTTPQQPVEQLAFGSVVLLAPVEAIPRGTKLSQAKLREVYWPRNEVPEGAIRRTEDVNDKFAKVDLPASQPIVRANVSAVPLLGGLSDLIPPGHRALTIKVDATAGVEGWAKPGAHVDILLTFQDNADGMKKTQIVVENAVVLSFNGNTRRSGQGESSASFSQATVTLATPIEEAMRIHTATAMGRISLILRNPGDVISAGNGVISETDFAKKNNAGVARRDKSTDGFARYTNPDGGDVHVELRGRKWWKVSGDEDL